MSGTLLGLADEYERDACGTWTSQRERWALRESAALFRRMTCNREAADPTRHTLTHGMLIDVTERWCRQHGYRAVIGHGGCAVQRDNEEVIVAKVGETLYWDGHRITVAT
ncbi:hypothetical protein PYK79_10770 [Streptomyces sp. ID05-04B]|uniref:hypothetical protein n=1 Tax=Streptomyces sp. ID05-04B TaxID=3028661 RepID=UPI0029C4B48C|nr:hypothetical protein [Streptomyces sp. ID05-04B]MDX5563735.1 hypothetical protein [Streptomyces sp. ID05-04B]